MKLHLAECYSSNYQFAEACELLEDILLKFPTDTFLQKRGLCSYAWNLYLLNESNANKSVELFQRAIKEYKSSLDSYQAHHYAVVLLKTNNKSAALSILDILENNQDKRELSTSLRYRYLKSEHRFEEALEAHESLVNIQNNVVRQTLEQPLIRSQRDYQIQAKELAEMSSIRFRERFHLALILFIVVLLSVVFMMHSFRKQAALKREQLIANVLEAQQMVQETSALNNGLVQELETVKRKYIASYKKQFQKTAALVENYYATSGKRNGRDLVYRQVMDLAASVGKDWESMRALERNVNIALDNAMSLYKEEFPDREREHYNLVCYYMAGFPASLIELFTGIPKNTIYSKKKRLVEDLEKSTAPHKDLFVLAIK